MKHELIHRLALVDRIEHLLKNGCTESHPEVLLHRGSLNLLNDYAVSFRASEYTRAEQECQAGCFGPCGRCEEMPVKVEGVSTVSTAADCLPPRNRTLRCPRTWTPCDTPRSCAMFGCDR